MLISFGKAKVMNQLTLSEPCTRLKPFTGDSKLKAVSETCYLCRRLSSIASQVENCRRAPGELPLAGFKDEALKWHRFQALVIPSVSKFLPTVFR